MQTVLNDFQTEMEQWWLRNSIDLGSHTKDEVEDLTGSIPLLLNSCVVDGKIDLSVQELRNVFEQVQKFMADCKLEAKENRYWIGM